MTLQAPPVDLLGQFDILVGHSRDLDRTTGATGDFFRIALQNSPGTTANGADANEANIHGFHSFQYQRDRFDGGRTA